MLQGVNKFITRARAQGLISLYCTDASLSMCVKNLQIQGANTKNCVQDG